MKGKKILGNIIEWRLQHISDRYFILMLSIIVGVASGLAAYILKTAVFYLHNVLLSDIEFRYDNLLLLVYPSIGILLAVILKKYILNDEIKHNISSILHAISKRNSQMRRHKIFSSILGGTFTAGFGGSIGLESPIISSGAAIGSNLGRILKLNYKTITILLACGAAGAVSAIFNTPVAGIVFALEVLLIDLTRFSLIPLLMASVSGTITTRVLFEEAILLEFQLTDPFLIKDIPFFILLGIVAGILSWYFTRVFLWIEDLFASIKKSRYRVIAGSIILGLLIFLFPALYGEGYEIIKLVLSGNHSFILDSSIFAGLADHWWIFAGFCILLILLKVIATSSTIGAGGIGGVFAPALFTGAFMGFMFAYLFNLIDMPYHLSESNFALVGMACLLGGVLHAPLTGIFLIAEITSGYGLIVPLMLATTISFVTVKYLEPNSIFTMLLAKKGELITHHKDKAVLTFMNLKSVIEKDFITIDLNADLGDLVRAIKTSKRNIYPVTDHEGVLWGIVSLDNVREIMFEKSLYKNTYVRNLMVAPSASIFYEDTMDEVIRKFNDTNEWNLPVIDKGKYIGFVSRSKLFSVYRELLVEISEE